MYLLSSHIHLRVCDSSWLNFILVNLWYHYSHFLIKGERDTDMGQNISWNIHRIQELGYKHLWGTISLPHQQCFKLRGAFNGLLQKMLEHYPVEFLLQVSLQAGNDSCTQRDIKGPTHFHIQDTQNLLMVRNTNVKQGFRDINVLEVINQVTSLRSSY